MPGRCLGRVDDSPTYDVHRMKIVALFVSATSRPAVSRIVMIAVAFATYCAFAFVYTWPLARLWSVAIPDPGDPLLNLWILQWDFRAMTTLSPLFEAPIFVPAKHALAFSENLLGVALLTLPGHLAGLTPIETYNFSSFLAFATAGTAGFVMARAITLRVLPAFCAGFFFAFVPFRFDHLSHLQHLWTMWLPLLVWATLRLWERLTLGSATILCLVVAMNGLTNIHWLLFGNTALLLSIPFVAAASGNPKRFLVLFTLAFGIGNALLVPILVPYKDASTAYSMKRHSEENLEGSARLEDWLAATPRSDFYGDTKLARKTAHERRLFPGFFAIIALVLALSDAGKNQSRSERSADTIRVRRWPTAVLDFLFFSLTGLALWAIMDGSVDIRLGDHQLLGARSYATPAFLALLVGMARLSIRYPWNGGAALSLRDSIRARSSPALLLCSLWLAIGFLGSFGLNGFFHEFLFERFEIFRSIRTPARWAMISYVGMTGFIAAAFDALLRRKNSRPSFFCAALLTALLIFELRPRTICWYLEDATTPPVYRWLAASQRRTAVLEIPISNDGGTEVQYLFRQTSHWRPLLNGISGFEPPTHSTLAHLQERDPIPSEFLQVAKSAGADLIVVHADSLGNFDRPVREWLRSSLMRGEIEFVRRFDHHVQGDWVFALRSATASSPVRLSADLDRFLSGEHAFASSRMIGRVDRPEANSEVRGKLVVSGWVAGPGAARRVFVHLQNRSVVVEAKLVPRADVASKYAGLQGETTGFHLELETRPNGVRKETDVQVEIVDSTGNRTWLSDIWVDWQPRRSMQLNEWKMSELEKLAARLELSDGERLRVLAVPEEIVAIAYERVPCECPDREFIYRSYDLLLGRPVDEMGLDKKLRALNDGLDRRDILDELITSKEFADRHGH